LFGFLFVEEEVDVNLNEFFEHTGGMMLTYKLSPTTTGLFIDGSTLKGSPTKRDASLKEILYKIRVTVLTTRKNYDAMTTVPT
jgi:hypothetical protein